MNGINQSYAFLMKIHMTGIYTAYKFIILVSYVGHMPDMVCFNNLKQLAAESSGFGWDAAHAAAHIFWIARVSNDQHSQWQPHCTPVGLGPVGWLMRWWPHPVFVVVVVVVLLLLLLPGWRRRS
jgi:hypothetical protein